MVWKSVTGAIIEPAKLPWKIGQPNNFGGNQNYVSNKPSWETDPSIGLADDKNSKVKESVCDLS